MTDRLSVSTDVLIEAGHALRTVATEFADANHHSDLVADAVGHHALAGAIRAFAHDWDIRRGKMVEGIAELAAATKSVGEGFQSLDTQLGSALRGEAPVRAGP